MTVTDTGVGIPRSPILVLVVGNEPDLADLLCSDLEAAGLRVALAAAGVDAIKMARGGSVRT